MLTRAQQEIIDAATHEVTRAVIPQYKAMAKTVGEESAPRFMLSVLMLNAVQVALLDRRLGDASGALDGTKFAAEINQIISECLHHMTLN